MNAGFSPIPAARPAINAGSTERRIKVSHAHRCNIYKVARSEAVRRASAQPDEPEAIRVLLQADCTRDRPGSREGASSRPHADERLRANAAELYADVVEGVSALLIENPDLVKSPTLARNFNAIDLGRLRRKIKAMKLPVENWKALLVLVSVRFYRPSG
ncbi:hypothetical protein [Neorhizobium sp. DT-125]|uniref:hypothetical protein n=1 Tax=Neorhizobium sp. DT-125 TaxID=3396163 RepID=UPI003F1DCAE5